MAKDSPSRSLDRFIIRLPEGMREQLQSRAAANKRSMNAEVVEILQRALREAVVSDAKTLANEIRRLQAEIDITARNLNLLTDTRNRMRNSLAHMEAPVRLMQRVYSPRFGDGTAASDAYITRDGEWKFSVEWDADTDMTAPSEISASEVELRGLIGYSSEFQTRHSTAKS